MKDKNILIVDDKQVNIQILSRFLSKYGFNIKTAESGEEALRTVEYFIPHVVLMDICMPGMDGIDCIKEMKKILNGNFFIIFISALKDSATKKRAFSVGATSYMNKPVDLKMLKHMIENCLETGSTDILEESLPLSSDEHEKSNHLTKTPEFESKIHHFNKLKDLGQLSSSIAHDINNYLGGILGNVSLIELSTEDEEIINCCKEIKKAVNSTSALTESMTSYSKKEPSNKKLVSLVETLNDALNLIERDARYSASISKDFKDDETLVKGVYSELTNIFLNILTNAYQAVENDGTISISLETQEFKKAKPVFRDSLEPGDYTLVEIADNGKGIPADVLEHMFEPFFGSSRIAVK